MGDQPSYAKKIAGIAGLLCSNGGGLVYGTCQWQKVDSNPTVPEIEYISAVASKARNQCIPQVVVSSYKPPSLAI